MVVRIVMGRTTVHHYTACHWGIYEVDDAAGQPVLRPLAADHAPSPIGQAMLAANAADQRVRRPAVRRGWLDAVRAGRVPDGRGRGDEPFVELPWEEALALVAADIGRVRRDHGNEAIFGGSYGWSSAGRFHHAQSQVHRFLNAIGGYVRHADTYSLGAARVLLPHIVGPMDELIEHHTSWDVLAAHTKLFVSFGGVPAKNAQISPGGVGEHNVGAGLRCLAEAGVHLVNVSPVRDNLGEAIGRGQASVAADAVEWLPIRPNTDTAMMLALAHTLQREGLHDRAFLDSHCVGYPVFERYLLGVQDGQPKDARWAEAICGVPAARIEQLARQMAAQRTMLNIAWSLQRADHGEQPFWALVSLAAMLGQVGLPGGGFGLGYGAMNRVGNQHVRIVGPTLPQGASAVKAFIPVARITDMLEQPGAEFDYNGRRSRYPHIRLIYWAGGNPFHHHQDLGRLRRAWRQPQTVIVNESVWTPTAKLADVVLPATTTFERDDIAFATRERYMVAMKRVVEPQGEARDDYTIFADLAERLGAGRAFTEGLDAAGWLRRMYDECRAGAKPKGVSLPDFDTFWSTGLLDLEAASGPDAHRSPVMLSPFRAAPTEHPLSTPSGRIEIFSERIAGFAYDDCAGHARWYEPAEWLGLDDARKAALGGEGTDPAGALHLLSDQPHDKLHSQLDHGEYCASFKRAGRAPVRLSPADARSRGIADGDLVRVFNVRGATLATATIDDGQMPGVAKLSTGAWFDPWRQTGPLVDKHGNPNAVTRDAGASSLSQGCAAQTCLVWVEPWRGEIPAVTAFDLPARVSA